MSWLDDIFSGIGDFFGGGASSAPSTEISGITPQGVDSSFGSIAPVSSLENLTLPGGDAALGAGLGGAANISGANDAFTGDTRSLGTPQGMPPGLPPASDSAPSSVSSQAAGLADVNRSEDSPYYSRTPGVSDMANPGASVSSTPAPPPPSAWESIQQAPGKWWQGVTDEFDKNPIKTTAAVAIPAAGLGAGIYNSLANQPPRVPKYIANPPASPVAPLPDLTPSSPMNPLLQGGFNVGKRSSGI